MVKKRTLKSSCAKIVSLFLRLYFCVKNISVIKIIINKNNNPWNWFVS